MHRPGKLLVCVRKRGECNRRERTGNWRASKDYHPASLLKGFYLTWQRREKSSLQTNRKGKGEVYKLPREDWQKVFDSHV